VLSVAAAGKLANARTACRSDLMQSARCCAVFLDLPHAFSMTEPERWRRLSLRHSDFSLRKVL
jgi:hypothetical protein